MFGWSSKWSS